MTTEHEDDLGLPCTFPGCNGFLYPATVREPGDNGWQFVPVPEMAEESVPAHDHLTILDWANYMPGWDGQPFIAGQRSFTCRCNTMDCRGECMAGDQPEHASEAAIEAAIKAGEAAARAGRPGRSEAMSYVVLVTDGPYDPNADHYTDADQAEIIGPFPTMHEAEAWMWREQRYTTQVLPVTFREPA